MDFGRSRLKKDSKLPPTCHPQAEESEDTVEHEEFVAEAVGKEGLGKGVDEETKQGRGDGDIRHKAVVDLPTGEKSEGKEAEQRSVGVGTENVYGIDDAGGVDDLEGEDEECKDEGYADMGTLAQPLVVGALANVNTIAGGERSEG